MKLEIGQTYELERWACTTKLHGDFCYSNFKTIVSLDGTQVVNMIPGHICGKIKSKYIVENIKNDKIYLKCLDFYTDATLPVLRSMNIDEFYVKIKGLEYLL